MSPVHLDSYSDIENKLNTIEQHLNLATSKDVLYAFKLIKKFVKDYHINLLNEVYVMFLVRLSIKLACVYYTEVRIYENSMQKKSQINNSHKTLDLFKEILGKLFNRNYRITYDAVIEALDECNLWIYESFCVKVTEIFLSFSGRELIVQIIQTIKNFAMGENTIEFRKINGLLNMLMEISGKSSLWPVNDEDLLMKLIGLHVICIHYNNNALKHGIEVCIRKSLTGVNSNTLLTIIEYVLEVYSVNDMDETYLRNLENIIQMATSSFLKTNSIFTTFKYDTFIIILTLMSSDNTAKCMFGNQTFQNMIDSEINAQYFVQPRIFFKGRIYNFKINRIDPAGEEFLKRYRKEFHLTFLTGIKNHKDDEYVLTSFYTSICLLMTCIPCEFTAAMIVCLVLNIQKNTLSDENISAFTSHRIHALVISVMSLVCWISQAKMLYTYLEKILKKRAYSAPFLNPPFKHTYSYATHYVLWNNPDFFFQNFEVRYAMWKRFRLQEKLTDRPCIFDVLKMKSVEKKSIFRHKF